MPSPPSELSVVQPKFGLTIISKDWLKSNKDSFQKEPDLYESSGVIVMHSHAASELLSKASSCVIYCAKILCDIRKKAMYNKTFFTNENIKILANLTKFVYF
jgi:hypothetical protein